MQLGIFTIGDVTTDPTTGRTPTENERIRNTVEIALKAEEIGLARDKIILSCKVSAVQDPIAVFSGPARPRV